MIDRGDKFVVGIINKVIPGNRDNLVDDDRLVHTTLLVSMSKICPRRGIEVETFTRFYVRRNGNMFQSNRFKIV